MKLSLKLIVGISSLAVITTAGVFATTSCSKANPFEKYNVGDDITIKSKGDANKLKDVAKERIYGDSIEINRGNNPTNYSSLAKQSTFAI
ncbi:hypothetical protein FACS1894166_02490 [Bacilli bacterium]|nr:hypothetical protein FACS1894166_02490 [Bacilli bacterium]